MTATYNENFFDRHLQASVRSAEEVIPLVLNFIRPHSVIDIGCGVGTWLNIWERNGVKKISGVDGDYVSTDKLLIPRENFIKTNLENGFSFDNKYDLVTCLEVAEHISNDAAEKLISSLCKSGDVILFSAAIPSQGGTHHINEQYPSYWLKHFLNNGFVPVDCLRKKIWSNPKISFWYRQNLLFYVKESSLTDYQELNDAAKDTDRNFLDIVHPDLFNRNSNESNEYSKILRSRKNTLSYLINKLIPWNGAKTN